ncbi:MAG: dehydrogenase [Planctomycetes bacterium]|nr:dehydrogenase [Planctomycetota bacterium]
MRRAFRVGITRDFLKADGSIAFGDIGLDLLDAAPGVEREFLAETVRELRPDQVRDYDALLLLGPRLGAASLEGADRLALVSRFGVGYDNVDVPACTRHGVALTITPDGVRRPVAVAAITLLLAAAHKLVVKDKLTREGRWAEKLDHMGMGVKGRTLGLIGLGNIGREIARLAKPFEMRLIASDPYAKAADVAALGVDLVGLDDLLRAADFACVACALTDETRRLIDARRIGLMKPTAYLINVARGPIVDQAALTAALRERRIQGAALDVFEEEPVSPRDPLLGLENVILAPHAICWTDECFRENGLSACRKIAQVATGRVPENVVNREVLESPRFLEKLRRCGLEAGG